MQRRKCDANANADSNAEANEDVNGIQTKNNMSPSLKVCVCGGGVGGGYITTADNTLFFFYYRENKASHFT